MDACQYGKDTREMLNTLQSSVDSSLEKMAQAIEKNNDKVTDITIKYVNRLPVWATLLIGGLMTVVGILLGKLKVI